MPVGEKTDGMETEGLAKVPPIAGPIIVPMDHTNGITAYARAMDPVNMGSNSEAF